MPIELGPALKRLRQNTGASQRDAAKAIGISYVHLNRLENNKEWPSRKCWEKIEQFYAVDLYALALALKEAGNER